jgi:hypothetical protein
MLRKPIGLIYQKFIEHELLNQGFVVSETIGDYSPYDLVSGWGAKLNKIQVKGSAANSKKNKGYKICATWGSNHAKLTLNECDFIIAVIGDNKRIYIIPVNAVESKTFRIHPNNVACRFLIWLERWDLLM